MRADPSASAGSDDRVADLDDRLHAERPIGRVDLAHRHDQDPEQDDPGDVRERTEHMQRQQPAAGGNRLEAAGAPAAVEVDVLVGRATDDRRRVGRDVDDPGPCAQQVRAGELQRFDRRGQEFAGERRIAEVLFRAFQLLKVVLHAPVHYRHSQFVGLAQAIPWSAAGLVLFADVPCDLAGDVGEGVL